MSNPKPETLGALVQAYVRARWGDPPDREATERLGANLEQALRHRLELLGTDVERLLEVQPAGVLPELEALEREAAVEDAGAMSSARRARAREESHHQAKTTWRDHRSGPGGHSGPSRRGGRGPRRRR